MTASRTYPLLRLSSRLIVDFVEQRRHTGEDRPPVGYDQEERRDLNELLDATNAFGT
jgi:hypothetical protein